MHNHSSNSASVPPASFSSEISRSPKQVPLGDETIRELVREGPETESLTQESGNAKPDQRLRRRLYWDKIMRRRCLHENKRQLVLIDTSETMHVSCKPPKTPGYLLEYAPTLVSKTWTLVERSWPAAEQVNPIQGKRRAWVRHPCPFSASSWIAS